MFFKVRCRSKAARKRMSFTRCGLWNMKINFYSLHRGKSLHPLGGRWRVAPDEGDLRQAADLRPHQSPTVTASPDRGKPSFGKSISMACVSKKPCVTAGTGQDVVTSSAAFRRRLRHLPKIRRHRSRSCRRRKARPVWGRWGTWPARAGCALRPPRPHGCCQTH